jgi:hypothetical protein
VKGGEGGEFGTLMEKLVQSSAGVDAKYPAAEGPKAGLTDTAPGSSKGSRISSAITTGMQPARMASYMRGDHTANPRGHKQKVDLRRSST